MNNNTPSVSVVISTYNRAHLVERAIRSVLNQTYRDFELIVVDDASGDNTREVVDNFHDERIRYMRHDDNKGAPEARNTGIKKAGGRYIAFLDDDDEWLPEKLEKQMAKMREASDRVGLIYTGSEVVEEKGKGVRKTYYPQFKGDVSEKLLLGPLVGSVSKVLVKKECFDEVGLFDGSLKSCQDWDMWKRISDHYEFDFVVDPLTRIYLHGDQISTDLGALIPGRTRMIEKHMDDFREHPEILVIHTKRMGKLHCINGTWAEAVYWFKQAIKINVLEIFKILAWCLVEMPIVKARSKFKNFKKYKIKNKDTK